MKIDQGTVKLRLWNRMRGQLLPAAALVALMAMAMPMHADNDRAVKSRVNPLYPELAKRMHIEGEVKLEATVDANGKVTDVKEVTGNHVLSVAAQDAVRQWKFVPGDGESKVLVSLMFNLH